MLQRYLKIAVLAFVMSALPKMYSMEKSMPIPVSTAGQINTLLEAHKKMGNFSGAVLVVNHGKILISKGYGLANYELDVPNKPIMKFRIASLTKQFTAAAILLLQEKGLLKITDSLQKYIPDFPHAQSITLHQLLCHASGIPNITFFSDFSQKCMFAITLDKEIEYIKEHSQSLDFVPGTQYTYSNSNYLILSFIVQKVSGQSFESYLDTQVLQPLGMTHSGLDHQSKILPNRASGYVKNEGTLANAPFFDFSWAAGSGGMFSTIEDMYRWDRALFSDKQNVFPSGILQEIIKPHIAISKGKLGMAYGYGIAVHNDSNETWFSHEGNIQGFSAYMAHYQSDDSSIIVLSNFAFSPYKTIAKNIRAILTGKSYTLPSQKKSCILKAEILQKYAGTYELQAVEDIYKRPAVTITIRAEKDHLTMIMKNKQQILLPSSETDFFIKTSNASIHFEVDSDKKVTGLIMLQNEEVTPGIKVG